MIETMELTKAYGKGRAVDELSFTAQPGRVTGFLGLNGSGKTTTLRMLLGLTRPTAGVALIDGRPFSGLKQPLREVGAVLEQGISHPGQGGRAHLRGQAMLAGASRARVDLLLDQVGLSDAAHQRTGDYSLGMRQRLAVATALLGEPKVLVLDEPANGLDPEGIAWLRGLLREHAYAGGTVLISSHQLAELAQLIDDVVVIANGRLRHEGPLTDLYGMTVGRVRVRGSDPQRLTEALENAGGKVTAAEDALTVDGLSAEETGEIAFAAGVPLHELLTDTPNLEHIFLDLAAA
jgi:ABC-2 type transport system ATP-binding protein